MNEVNRNIVVDASQLDSYNYYLGVAYDDNPFDGTVPLVESGLDGAGLYTISVVDCLTAGALNTISLSLQYDVSFIFGSSQLLESIDLANILKNDGPATAGCWGSCYLMHE